MCHTDICILEISEIPKLDKLKKGKHLSELFDLQ